MTHGEVYCRPEELFEFSNLYKQKSGEYVLEWILRVQDKSGRNIKLDQAKFIDMNSLSGNSALNLAVQVLKKGGGSNCLFSWLKRGPKDGPS